MKNIYKILIGVLFVCAVMIYVNTTPVYATELDVNNDIEKETDINKDVINVTEKITEETTKDEKVVEDNTTKKDATDKKTVEKATVEKTTAEKATAKKLTGEDVVKFAVRFVGNPYRAGGCSLTKGTDCSGFVMSVYKNFGYKLPHSSRSLRSVGKKVSSLSEAKPGDILCYSGHVAIYMGNNKIVHASTKKTGIKISDNAKYKKILAIRRIV